MLRFQVGTNLGLGCKVRPKSYQMFSEIHRLSLDTYDVRGHDKGAEILQNRENQTHQDELWDNLSVSAHMETYHWLLVIIVHNYRNIQNISQYKFH